MVTTESMASFIDNFSDLQELGINVSESNDCLSDSFARAADHLQKLMPNVDSQKLLTLYGYYKQGTEGPCNIPKPSWYDIRSKAKWEAWKHLGDMSPKQAKIAYIDTIKALDPSFEDLPKEGLPKEHWAKVSSMLAETIPPSELRVADHIKNGDVAEVQQYLKSKLFNAQTINKLDEEGLALIHWATDSGHLDMVKVLVEAGADLGIQDSDGQTALHYASSCGHANCVKYLLNKGADAGVLDNDGNSPVDVTTDNEIKELFIK